MFLSKIVGASAIVLAAAGAIVAAQNLVPGFRTMTSDISPPGIDAGLRVGGASSGPRTLSHHFVDRPARRLPHLSAAASS